MAGLIDKITLSANRASTWLEELRSSPIAQELAIEENILYKDLQYLGQKGNIDELLNVENILIKIDLQKFTNNPVMKTSLETAVQELQAAKVSLEKVRNPAEYRAIDEEHSLKRNRSGHFPKDQARQFFSSHSARLLNSMKARPRDTERTIIMQRRTNIRAAEKIYKTMQEHALGITNDKSQSRGPSMGL